MSNKAVVSGIVCMAVVLFVAVLFAGAASADVSSIAPEHPTSAITVAIINDDGSSGTLTIDSDFENVSLIANEANWKNVTENSGMWSKTLVLTNDIVFSEPVSSIGTSSNFNGTIYGNGSKFVNFTQSGADAHGLIYSATDGCVLNNVHLYDGNIASGNSCVGGLVGQAYSASTSGVRLCGCSVEYSTVTSGTQYVGGLVGGTNSATLWINASGVDHAYVQSSGGNYVGGLVGGANSDSPVNIYNTLVNCSEIYASGESVGGLVGYATFPSTLTNTSVRDCKIWSGNSNVGSLVGNAQNASTMNGCAVENCTVSGNSNVGGLVGYADYPITFTGVQSWVNYTWVSAEDDNVGSLFGKSCEITSLNLAPEHNEVYSTTEFGTENCYDVDNDFNGTESSASDAFYTDHVGSGIGITLFPGINYGYGSAPPRYTVTNDPTILNGNLLVSPTEGTVGTTIAVTAVPESGYRLNWTYYNNSDISGSPKIEIKDGAFTLPEYNVTVSGDFELDWTTVEYYNNTNALVNTSVYTFGSPFVIPVYPENSSVTVNGWNVSSADGYYFANATFAEINETYVKSGTWNYTNSTGDVLTVYMNYSLKVSKPIVSNVTVDPSEVTEEKGATQEVTLTAELWGLPSGYTEVEYIESSGAQYINTGVNANIASTSILTTVLDCQITSTGNNRWIFGGYPNDNGGNYLYGHYNGGNCIGLYQTKFYRGTADTNRHTITINGENGCYIDDTWIGDTVYNTYNLDNVLYLFASHHGGGVNSAGGKVWSCKMWIDGSPVRDFVPCIRDSDGVIGMYDLVTDRFFTNAGSGEFSAAPDVISYGGEYGTVNYEWLARNTTTDNVWMLVNTTAMNRTTVTVSKDISTEFCVNVSNVAGFSNTSETPVKLTVFLKPVVENVTVTPAKVQAGMGGGTRTVAVAAEPWLGLPSEYTEVEYIVSTGAQYINTGVNANIASTSILTTVLDCQITSTGDNRWIFGGYPNDNGGNYLYGHFYDGNCIGLYQYKFYTGTADTNRHTITINGENGCYIDDTWIGETVYNTYNLDNVLYLFASHHGGGVNSAGGKVWSCKMWIDGSPVRDFVPCIRDSDGVIGMYDLVTDRFFTNAGSGKFSAGPEVISYGGEYGTVNYEWFSRNTTTGNAWVSIGNTLVNVLSYTVSTTESTQFYANATNIAGNNESTKDNPAKFTVYTTLTLDANGGDNTSQVVNATLGSSVLDKTVNASTKEDCTFRGWDVIASPKNLTVINETGVLVKGVDNYTDGNGNWTNATGAITLYANWSSVYTIRYHANNGTTVNVTMTDIPYNKSVTLNSTVDLGFTPQDGLTFVKWTTYANGTGSSYADEAEVKNLVGLDETADLYAVWQTNKTALNSSTAEVTIGGTAYTKWNASAKSPYVVGYDTFNGTAVFGPFVIESPGHGETLNYTLTAQNLTEADELGRVIVTYIDDGTVTPLDNTTGFSFEDHDGNGYINLTESGRKTTGLSNVSVVVKEYPLGDANTNDQVDIVDSASVGVYILKGGGETVSPEANVFLPDENKVHGDVDHNGLVDVADLLKINQYLVGAKAL